MAIDIKLREDISPLEELSLLTLSYSRINSFDWCQAQFFYNYILKIPQASGAKALLGNVIHKALEVTVRDGEITDAAELLDNYRAAREEYDPDESIISEELIQEGYAMLDDYMVRNKSSKARITTAELAFEFVFHGTLLRGLIDSVYITDEDVYVIDYKSGAWEVSDKNVQLDLQLGIYAMYMKFLYPDKKITASLYYLRSDKFKTNQYTDQDFEDIQDRLRKAIDGIREHNNFLPVGGYLAWKCRMCSYRDDGTCKAGQFNVEQSDKKKNKMIGNNSYSDYI